MHKYLALIAFLFLGAAVLGNLVQNRPRATYGDTITAQWVDNATDEDGYRVYWDTAPATYGNNSGDLAANSTSFEITGLTPSTLYYGKTVAFKTVGGESTGPLLWQMYTTDASNVLVPAPVVNGTIANQTDNEGDTISTLSTSTAFTAGGGTTYSVIEGALPAGLSMDTAGDVTGTITAGEAANSPFSIRVRATDGIGRIVDQAAFTWTVASPLANIKTGMLAWYDFDDATDSHSTGNDGAVTGSPAYGDPTTLNSTDYIEFPAAIETALDASSEATIIAMIRTSSGQLDGDNLLASGANRTRLRYDDSGLGLVAIIYTVQDGSTTATMTTSTIYQVGVMATDVSGGNITTASVFDGSIGAQSAATAKGLFGDSADIGTNAAGTDFYWLGVWDRALTAAEITALDDETLVYGDLPAGPATDWTADPTMVALYSFESGAIDQDSVGTNHVDDAVTSEDPAPDTTNHKELAQAADFEQDGVDDGLILSYANAEADFPCNGTGDGEITIGGWVRPESIAVTMTLVGINNLQQRFQVFGSGVLYVDLNGSASDEYTTTATLTAGSTYFVAYVYSDVDDAIRVYIREESAGSSTWEEDLTITSVGTLGDATGGTFQVGAASDGGVGLDGVMDGWGVFNGKAMTQAELDGVFDNGWDGDGW